MSVVSGDSGSTCGTCDTETNPIEDRIDALRAEWTDYVKERLSENHRFIHIWRTVCSTTEFTRRMTRMANKYLGGVLTESTLIHFNICVYHFVCALSAFHVGMPTGTTTIEAYHKFAENYFQESFDHMYTWNWALAQCDPAALQPIRDDPVDPPYDPAANNGFPSFVQFSVGSPCDCGDDSCSDDGKD